MATPVLFNCFALDVGKGLHNFSTDVLKIYLTNATPSLSNTVYNTPADLSTAGGYTAGGVTIGTNTWSQASGLASLVAGVGSIVWTATTGFGPFRYAVLYNFTAAAKNLIGYVDYGAPTSIAAAGTFTAGLSSPLFTLRFQAA